MSRPTVGVMSSEKPREEVWLLEWHSQETVQSHTLFARIDDFAGLLV